MKDIIRATVSEILDAITDPTLKELVRTKTFLTGGCFKAIYNKETINDFDFYFVDRESATKFETLVRNGLEGTTGFTDRKKMFLDDIKHKSEFAISFMLKNLKIQFITKYVGLPEMVVRNFDFEHTRNYYVPALDVFQINEDILANKKLIFNPYASHPVNALKRLQKFIQQGWTIDDIEIMKMAEAINKLNLASNSEYREQASGMYLYRESAMRGYNSKRSIG